MSLDNESMTIYGDSISGNCLKVKFVADRLGLPYDWVEVSVLKGETRTPDFLAMNPAGQVPVVLFADDGPLAQSNAIMLHLAQNTDLIPDDAFDRALMFQWLFWEQKFVEVLSRNINGLMEASIAVGTPGARAIFQ